MGRVEVSSPAVACSSFAFDDGKVGAAPAESAVVVVYGPSVPMRRRRKRGPAGGAELRPLTSHAGCDLARVGNELAAQPLRVGRASLLLFRGGLRNRSRSRRGAGQPDQAENRGGGSE